MGRRSVRIVVLCEDKQQFSFAYRCLKRLGFGPRDIQGRFAALGREGGAGEKFVRDNYLAESAARRSRHAASDLLVVIDADVMSASHRETQLASLLSRAKPPQEPRQATEAIAHWIPKRNIETWIHFLLGAPVDESQPYPKLRNRERDCDPAAKRFIALAQGRERPPEDAPPSLVHGVHETKRLSW
jgi:hypothetical protein